MLDLVYQMMWRMCMIVTIAFLITRLDLFRKMIYQPLNWKGKSIMIFVFGIFGIIGNYTGIMIHPDTTNIPIESKVHTMDSLTAIADTRNIGVLIGGLFGGPAVGMGAGIIAGGHRYFIGGFISEATFILTVMGGLIAGWVQSKISYRDKLQPFFIFVIGVLILFLQISLIPLFTESHKEAFFLIKLTGLPIIIVNGVGIWICALLFYSVIREEEKTKAYQTQKALFIANKTLPFFRKGLNKYSSQKVTEILCIHTDADDVAITDMNGVSIHARKNVSYDLIDDQEVIKKVLHTRKVLNLNNIIELRNINADVMLKAIMFIPLFVGEKPVGTLKMYYTHTQSNTINDAEEELAKGLMLMFSTQLELGELDAHKELLQNSKIKALQAQIHPHFLFNSINVIVALCKKNPLSARKLLIQLSTFLRNNMNTSEQNLIPIEKELESVIAYFALEQARFPGRYTLKTKIENGVEKALIPPFTIQPLVENALLHGFVEKSENQTIELWILKKGSYLKINIKDNGIGIPRDKLMMLGSKTIQSEKGNGIAIHNIRERLELMFGPKAEFLIDSQLNKGTNIFILIPFQSEKGEEFHDRSLYS
ncbi:LytS/YhcK type 5TM receptor domain-containing protein [Mesobacillus foraminis]|uniref:LytS/YhcK type 5TM receptor domain-containing protein n=1 Tax=Mesobacillus foraminis TaxID=279826 RepID=UPI000EF4F118|nr:LytS/YhcK type 5TM receptor domain-containing protein [Mesobacillus foraminis]